MTGNLVGGNTAEKENVIEGSGGPAIEILEEALEPGSTTEIARNRGGGNGGLFIDLVAGRQRRNPAAGLLGGDSVEGRRHGRARRHGARLPQGERRTRRAAVLPR